MGEILWNLQAAMGRQKFEEPRMQVVLMSKHRRWADNGLCDGGQVFSTDSRTDHRDKQAEASPARRRGLVALKIGREDHEDMVQPSCVTSAAAMR